MQRGRRIGPGGQDGGGSDAGSPRADGFVVGELIGEGGFSRVFVARQETMDRPVALKVFRTAGKVGKRNRERFEREASIVGRLSTSDGLVTVFVGGFTQDGAPYLAMELCESGSLADRIRQVGPLPVSEVVGVAERIGLALAAVHQQGVYHRDVKPSNILLGADGRALLTDFGLSVVGEMNDALGDESRMAMTEVYAPPERLNPDDDGASGFDAAGDQYSFALTLYAMLLGGSPFTGETTTKRALKALGGRLEPLSRNDLPAHLIEAIRRAISRDPVDRWPSMEAFVAAVCRPGSAAPPTSHADPFRPGPQPPVAGPRPGGEPDDPTAWHAPRTGEDGPEPAVESPPAMPPAAPEAPTPTVGWQPPAPPAAPPSAWPGAPLGPALEAEETSYGARDPGIGELRASQPLEKPAAPRRKMILGIAGAVGAILVLIVVWAVVGGTPDKSGPGGASGAATTTTAAGGAGGSATGTPKLDPLRLSDQGLSFTWSGDPGGDPVVYQVQVDGSRTSQAEPVDTNSAGTAVEEQFVTSLTFPDGTVESIDAESHSYCVVVLFVPIEGDAVQSKPQCVGG